MSTRLRLVALLALITTALSACVIVPVPARRAYIGPAPGVIVAPYPRHRHHHHDGYYRYRR